MFFNSSEFHVSELAGSVTKTVKHIPDQDLGTFDGGSSCNMRTQQRRSGPVTETFHQICDQDTLRSGAGSVTCTLNVGSDQLHFQHRNEYSSDPKNLERHYLFHHNNNHLLDASTQTNNMGESGASAATPQSNDGQQDSSNSELGTGIGIRRR